MCRRLSSTVHFWVFCALLFGATLWPRPVGAQSAGIGEPRSGATIRGVILVQGTAVDANFLRYELAFLQQANPGAGWIVFADGSQPVVNGTLAIWDTTVGQNVGAPVFPDGVYQLRLRIVRTDFNYDEFFVTGLIIANNAPIAATPALATPVPFPTAAFPTAAPPTAVVAPTEAPPSVTEEPTITPTPTEPPTATPLLTRGAPTLVPGNDATPPPPPLEQLPTLTPFPTPSPRATVERDRFQPIIREETGGGEGGSMLDGLLGMQRGRFGEAFSTGIRWTFYLFGAFGAYLLVRGVVRWLWRTIAANW